MYYINFIFFYSVLGFILESVYYKYKHSNDHSSIFIGPYTFVYGFGMFFAFLIFNFLNKYLSNNLFTYIIYYFIFVIATSLIEFVGGHIIHYFLKIDKWNYTKDKYHLGKYLTLKNCLIWGILVCLMIFYFHPYFDKNILSTIPNYFTIIYLCLFIIDLFLLIKKQVLKKLALNK